MGRRQHSKRDRIITEQKMARRLDRRLHAERISRHPLSPSIESTSAIRLEEAKFPRAPMEGIAREDSQVSTIDPAENLLLLEILPSREIQPDSLVFRAARFYLKEYRSQVLPVGGLPVEQARAEAAATVQADFLPDMDAKLTSRKDVNRGIMLANLALRQLEVNGF